ncbi:hypothetical protein [Lactiplantibacillus plantarum]|uniref:hypothetical protein n=1 Tax=Lactiplantibacillus plantarum TaxID=1590 RepID=UPI00287807FA|nr:hypothetical protein [Lactiplantibacillus plantarum]WND31698.1 hypothetical protein RI127_02985 [Lactiplantibacillus plantarum]
MYAVKTIDQEHKVLATGSEPELHRLVLSKYRRGQWPFPVVIEPEQAQPWDDKAYLESMRPNPETEEREQIKEIRHAHRAGKHTIRAMADETGYITKRVSYLVHKYSLPLRNEYWRAEKYDNPNEIITGQTVDLLGDKIGAPARSIRQASYSNGIVCGYYISRVSKV